MNMPIGRRDFVRDASFLCAALAAGCRRRAPDAEAVVYTSVDQVFSEPVFRDIEKRTGLKIRAVFDTEETKSTGVLNRLIAEAANPQADVFWSGDPVRPLLLVKRGLVEPYPSPSAAAVPERFRAADGSWTGLAARARMLLVNTKRLSGERPTSVRDLTDVRWKGQTAIANPLFGTTTMHVAALASVWGEDALKKFLKDLKANGVRVAASNGEVKRLVASGEVALGLLDSDDADEAIKDGAPVALIVPDQDSFGTLVMPTTLVCIQKAPHREAGHRLVDGLLSSEAEKRMAESGAHMPLRPDTVIPQGLRRANELRAMSVDYAKVADEMERLEPWLRQWAGL
jgi:iron(III) transport system substrate-binding protein